VDKERIATLLHPASDSRRRRFFGVAERVRIKMVEWGYEVSYYFKF
jgi:hypothetical protein